MDPTLLEMLQGIFASQSGFTPNAGGGSSTFSNQGFNFLREYMDREQKSNAHSRLNVDPLRDIEPYRVNPFRGFLAKKGGSVELEDIQMMTNEFMNPSSSLVPGGTLMDSFRNQLMLRNLTHLPRGGIAGQLPMIPATFQVDTINNVPSNIPGGAPGKFDLSQMTLQPQSPFTIPKSQAFSDPIWGNKLLDIDNRYQPAAFGKGGKTDWEYPGGGRVDTRYDRLLKRKARLERKGKTDTHRYENVLKRIQDIQSGGLGQTSFGQGLTDAAGGLGFLATAASPFLGPVGGVLGGLLGGALSNLGSGSSIFNQGNAQGNAMANNNIQSPLFGGAPLSGGGFNLTPQGPGYTPIQGSLYDRFSQPTTGGIGGLTLQGVNPMVLGQTPFGSGFGTPFVPQFQEGGPIEKGYSLVPVQTEKVGNQPEMIIHVDGTITPVNATTRHKYMDDDEVTDIVPEGSYITSADKNMKLSYKTADDIVLGIRYTPYKELKQGKVPEEVSLSELWGGSAKRDRTFADLTERLSKKYKVIDNTDVFEYGNDIFTQLTNKANLESRIPYIAELVRLNEERKPGETGSIGFFKHGGAVKLKGVKKAEFGDQIAALLPLLGSLFGGGGQQTPGGVSPFVQSGLLGTIPLYQAGVNQNIAAQSGALNQAVNDFSSLGNELIGNARQSTAFQTQANLANTGLGLLNQFSRERNLPRLSTDAQASRIRNFRPRSASRASIEAASTPNFDAQAIMNTLGPRSGPVIAQLYSDLGRNANAAAGQRNQFLDQLEQQNIGQLNQLDSRRDLFNIGQREKEIARGEDINSGIYGTLGQGVQRGADLQSGLLGQIGGIKSQLLPITTQFALQNAQLAGQNNILGAQNAFNAFSTLGGIQSQNALNQQLNGQNQSQQGNPLGGLFQSLFPTQEGGTGIGNLFRSIFGGARPTTVIDPLVGGPTFPPLVPPTRNIYPGALGLPK